MATVFDRFRVAVDELLQLGLGTSAVVAREEIILLSHSTDFGYDAAGSPPHDCTEPLLAALKWGLGQYGLDLYSGFRFFHALARLGRMLPHR